jgi:2-polyprenyl-6-methoxyphenol hydroxylase-like FAD-dependent oxidoreductase
MLAENAERHCNIQVLYDQRCESGDIDLTHADQHARIRIRGRDGQSHVYRTPLIIGADGINSVVREAMSRSSGNVIAYSALADWETNQVAT